MKIFTKKQLYFDKDSYSNFSYHKEFDNGLIVKMELLFGYGEYQQYQENMIKEMVEALETEANSTKFSIIKFKSFFELLLQELNSRLAVFADKLRVFNKISIKWFAEFFMDNYYVSSLIGDSSLVIFRKWKLYYALHNDATNNKKIDLFAELIEGDLSSWDEIIYFGNNISYFTDSEDFTYIGEIHGTDDRSLLQIIGDMLWERTDMASIGFTHLDLVTFDEHRIQLSKNSWLSQYIDKIHYRFKKRKYIMSIVWFGVLMLWLLSVLVANFLQTSNGITLSAVDGATKDYFSLAWLKKEIEEFKMLDASSPEKYNMFKSIENKIEQIEKEGKLPLDIKQLKVMLQSEYQQWFNIEKIDQLDDRSLTFNSTDLLDIGVPFGLYAGKQISVAGSQWVILWAVNDELKWITQKIGLESKLQWCTPNLQSNGLLCFDTANGIYNITKQSIQTASIGSWSFEKTIQQIGTFGNSNMYLLINNPVLNTAWTFIMRYPLIPGSKESFKAPINYTFGSEVATPWSFSSMSIDSTFLLRSDKDHSLYQLWRDGVTSKSRKVTLVWWKELTTNAWSGIKVISTINSSFVYLFLPSKQQLIVYKSNPSKATDWWKYNYTLKYFFALQLPSTEIYDISISDSSKPQLYVLTNKWVANIKLYDYIDSFDTIEKSNQQAKETNNTSN